MDFEYQSPRSSGSLWSRSSAWRWLLTLTALSALVFVVARPWETPGRGAKIKEQASYAAPAQAPATVVHTAPVAASQTLQNAPGGVPGQIAAGHSAQASTGSSLHPQSPPVASTAAATANTPFIDQLYSGEVALLGKKIPLPEGKWRGVAYMQAAVGRDELVVLAKIEQQSLSDLIAIRVAPAKAGSPPQQSCDKPAVFAKKFIESPDGSSVCWWINHASQLWNQPVFNLSASNLARLSVPLPHTFINTAFYKTEASATVTVFYYSNPEKAGISTPKSNWQNSDWHVDRVAQFPEKTAYLQKREAWAESWLPILKATK